VAPFAGLPPIGINAQKLSTRQSYHAAGSSRYVYNLLRELRHTAGPEKFVAYVGASHAPADLTPTPQFSLATTRFPTDRATARIFWEQFVLPRRLRHDGIGLLHGTVNALPVAWHGRAVVTILDLTFLLMPRLFNSGNARYLKWAVRHATRAAKRVITISETTRQDVIRLLGVPPERVTRIYCGVEERFKPLRGTAELAAFRASRQLPDDFILYLGTMEPRKNVGRLVQAYAALRRRGETSIPLVLAGGKGWGENAIFAEVERSGCASDIRYVGYVPEEEMPLWYNAATFFVYVSEYEGFGLPPLEALACGTPVITSDCSSLPEVVGDAGILVDPKDTDAIADAMQRLIGNPSLRAELTAGGPQRAGEFTWKRMAAETLAVYRDVSRA
jgi:glycosyltransferase involved in cell wall biosynthesis